MNNENICEFKPTGISIDYTQVNIKEKEVTANILYKSEIKVTIIINLDSKKIYKDGNFNEILNVLPSRDENSYIEEINDWAKIFIENKITNPKKYFESFITNEKEID